MSIPECSVACRAFFMDALAYFGALCLGYLLLCVTGVMGLIERHFDKHRSDFDQWEADFVLFDQDQEEADA